MNEILRRSERMVHHGLRRGRARYEGFRPGGLARSFLARCAPEMENTMAGTKCPGRQCKTVVSFSGVRWRGNATGRLRSLWWAPEFSDNAIEKIHGSGKDGLDGLCPSVMASVGVVTFL